MTLEEKAFLDLIAKSEGTSTHPLTKNNGYDVLVTGIHGPAIFSDYSDHPLAKAGAIQWSEHPPRYSTAAGRYQILAHYFEIYKIQLRLADFSPASQDAAALQQIRERHALPMIAAGNIQGAIAACANIWASFPGNKYGQGGHALNELTDWYHQNLAEG